MTLTAAALATATLLAGCAATARQPAAPVVEEPVYPRWVLETPLGTLDYAYEVRAGTVVAETDIVLGRAADIAPVPADAPEGTVSRTVQRGAAAWGKWPDGRIPYRLELTGGRRADFEIVALRFEERTPLRFVPHTDEANYIRVVSADAPPSAPVGMRGLGEHRITVPLADAVGDPTRRRLTHLLGHAAGLFHEHSRPDRRSQVSTNEACAVERPWLLERQPLGPTLGPFDPGSALMLASAEVSASACPALTLRGTVPTPVTGSARLSARDIASLWKLYGRFQNSGAPGDELGGSLVVGDFDGDGVDDFAAGAPAEGGLGAVYLFKGTDTVPVPWTRIDARRLKATKAGARFGEQLASGDFDGDGNDDLAVGVPGYDDGRGAVALFYGRPGIGLMARQWLHMGHAGFPKEQPGAGMGSALAAGDFDGDGKDDLAVGLPRALRHQTSDHCGAVTLFNGAAIELARGRPVFEDQLGGSLEDGDGFGSALASGRFDHDDRDDLAIGVPLSRDPSTGARSGGVYLMLGSERGPQRWRRLGPPGVAAEGNGKFGAALSTAPLSRTARHSILVGAPRLRASGIPGVGAAYLFEPSGGSETGQPFVLARSFDPVAYGEAERHAGFASRTALADVDGDGAPDAVLAAAARTLGGDRFASGQLYVFRQTASGFEPWRRFRQRTRKVDARFGTSLATLVHGRRAGAALLSGAPGDGAGSIELIVRPQQDGAGPAYPHRTMTHAHRWTPADDGLPLSTPVD